MLSPRPPRRFALDRGSAITQAPHRSRPRYADTAILGALASGVRRGRAHHGHRPRACTHRSAPTGVRPRECQPLRPPGRSRFARQGSPPGGSLPRTQRRNQWLSELVVT